jgi:hypothetical protein
MKFTAAVIKEQGLTFALCLVKASAVSTQGGRQNAADAFRPHFPGMPIIIAAQDGNGRFTYYGRQDIADFLASLHPSQIPWREYTIS